MRIGSRIHRRLWVEELETRTAPVSLAGINAVTQTNVSQIGDLTLRCDFAAPTLANFSSSAEVLAIDGTDWDVGENTPVMPCRTISLLLPPGTDLSGVDISVSNPISLGTWQPLISASLILTGEDGGSVSPGVLSANWTPQLYQVAGVQRLAGYTIASIVLYPILFDPATSQALFYSSMTIKANTVASASSGDEWLSRVRNNDADRNHVASLVDNPSILSQYAAAPLEANGSLAATNLPADTYDYVIITSDALQSSFDTLRAFKESQGVRTNITTTSYIYANYSGVDRAEQVRNFIRDAYNTWDVNYVLLGGDIDVVPYRGAYVTAGGYTESSMPCDLYFACLDGSWNNDGDSRWGESTDGVGGGDVDLLAEVYVGRAPVGNDTQTANFIAKTILYETQTPTNPTLGLWVGELLWEGPAGDVYGSYSKNPVREQMMPADYLYTTLYEEDGTFTKSNVIAGLNAEPHIVNHLGHANETYVLGIGNSDVDALTNDYPFFVYSQGCNAGAFDQSDCISEHFVFNATGAFASIMNARYGWGTTSGPPAYSHDFDMAFFRAVFQDGQTNIGKANQLSKEYNVAKINTQPYRWIYYELNLLGDPQTGLRTGSGSGGDAYEVDDTPEKARAIAVGGSAQIHSIHVPEDVDWVKFTLTQTMNITIETNGTSGNTRMWLYGPGNYTTEIAYDDDSGNGYFSKIVRADAEALGPGTYYVKIDESGNDNTISSYTLTVTSSSSGAGDAYEVDDTAAQAKLITPDGSPQTHSIHVGTDVDWVKFTLTQTCDVYIATNGASGDTRMWLYGPNSSTNLIEYDDDDGSGYFSYIERTGSHALTAGTYYVKVDEYGNNNIIASYTIAVLAVTQSGGDVYEVDNTAAQAKTITTDGVAQTHSIHVDTDVDWVKFTLTHTSEVTIETDGASGDTRMWLYGPNTSGILVAYDDDSGNGYFSKIVRSGAGALAPGVYYVKIDEYDNDDTIDAYTIAVTAVSYGDDPPSARVTVGNITTPGGTTHTFTVTYTDDTAIAVSGLDSNDIRVTGPYGFDQMATFLGVDNGSDGSPRTATYQIQALGGDWDANDSGTYTVRMQANQVRDSAGQYVPGGILGTFQVSLGAGLADLTLSVATGAAAIPVQVGGSMQVTTTERNIGAVQAKGGFFLDYYLSLNAVLGDDDDVFLGRVTETTTLRAGASKVRTDTLTVPLAASSGNYYVFGVIDAGGSVAEASEGNNTAQTASASVVVTRGRVLRQGDAKMVFTDSDGDVVQVNYSGSGYAVIADAAGGRPDLSNADIAWVSIFGNTKSSTLTVRDTASRVGPNTLTLGSMVTAAGAPMGTLRITNTGGVFRNTTVSVGGPMTQVYILGTASNLDLTVGGDLARFQITGNLADCRMTVNGNVANFAVTGAIAQGSSVKVTGAMNTFRVTQGIVGGSEIELDGNATSLNICAATGQASVDATSKLTIGGALTRTLSTRGDLLGTVDIRGAASTAAIRLTGGLTGSLLADVFGNVTVTGAFNGAITANRAGVNNTLRVSVLGGTGVVTPANAFAKYVGFAPTILAL